MPILVEREGVESFQCQFSSNVACYFTWRASTLTFIFQLIFIHTATLLFVPACHLPTVICFSFVLHVTSRCPRAYSLIILWNSFGT